MSLVWCGEILFYKNVFDKFWLCDVRFCYIFVWYSKVWHGWAWYSLVWWGLVRPGFVVKGFGQGLLPSARPAKEEFNLQTRNQSWLSIWKR